MMEKKICEKLDDDLYQAFRVFDYRGRGYIEIEDLHKIMQAVNCDLTADEIQKILKANKSSSTDGYITFNGKNFLFKFMNFFTCHTRDKTAHEVFRYEFL